MTSETSKRDLGRFVSERRRALGITQRELAARLHVTESAVSKWERGLSYPDITLVQTLAAELNVSGNELISASEDHEGRAVQRDARAYRGWRSAILWTTGIAYAVTLLTCVIVNLSVSHTLSWFWIVLAAVALAFSLTTLPLLPIPQRGWSALGGAAVSLAALLLIVRAQHAPGAWIWIVFAAVLFGLVCVFAPILLRSASLPHPVNRHLTVLSLAISTVALALLLLVIALVTGRPELWAWPMLPLVGIGCALVWAIALAIRYLPGSGWISAAVVALIVAVAAPAVNWAVDRVLGVGWSWTPDLLRWDSAVLESNILLLIALAAVAVAVACVLAAAVSGPAAKRRESRLARGSNPEV